MVAVACLVAIGASAAVCAWSALQVDTAWVARGLRREAELVCALLAKTKGSSHSKADAGRATLGQVSEMVDVVRLGISAGLSFDAALAMYCENRDGTLSQRMARAHLSWQMGMASREASLIDAARDLGIRQLESFASAVGQSHALGSPLSETLERQGKEMREAHRAEVERAIERAPVKMLIPTGSLILPALLLSIIGPLLAASGMI